jgi:hypothetical protein
LGVSRASKVSELFLQGKIAGTGCKKTVAVLWETARLFTVYQPLL